MRYQDTAFPDIQLIYDEHDVFVLAGQDGRLYGCADGYALIRVDALRRLFAQELSDLALDHRHARSSADQEYLVYLVRRKACIG